MLNMSIKDELKNEAANSVQGAVSFSCLACDYNEY